MEYSSETVKQLLENTKYNFWRKDWSERIQVQWDNIYEVPLAKFRKDIIKLIGKDFIYELALNNEPIEYLATVDGLKKV